MQHVKARLIEQLKQLPGIEDSFHKQRIELRTSLRSRAQLDLKRAGGDTVVVSAMDVSNSGLGFLSRQKLEPSEAIELRIAYADGPDFEPFQVRRATSTIGGYKIGVVAG